MCGQGCGKRVLCGALRSPIDFVVSSDGFVAWADVEDAEASLVSSSCSSSLRILSSCVSLTSANCLRSPGRLSRMCFFGDCRCSLSSGLGFAALTSFMAFICVLGSWKRSSLGGGKANSCAACFEGHNEGGFAVAPSGLQRRSSRVEKFKVWKALPIVVGGEMFSTVTGFPYGLVSRHNKRWKITMITKRKANLRSTENTRRGNTKPYVMKSTSN